VIGISPGIRAFQMYAPLDKRFVALEPQFNLAEPLRGIYPAGTDTGMVTLQPGQSVTYRVRLEIFVP
jgi:aldose 1-epimerase